MRYQYKWQDVDPAEVLMPRIRIIWRRQFIGLLNWESSLRRLSYGSSEIRLGRVLPSLPRDEIIVQTKVPPFETADEFYKTFDQSIAYLNLDYVDLLSLHGINDRRF